MLSRTQPRSTLMHITAEMIGHVDDSASRQLRVYSTVRSHVFVHIRLSRYSQHRICACFPLWCRWMFSLCMTRVCGFLCGYLLFLSLNSPGNSKLELCSSFKSSSINKFHRFCAQFRWWLSSGKYVH